MSIQKFFEQRKLGKVAQLLMERYALHIDQGTVLERELMLVLLGLQDPDEFAAALYENLPVSKQTVLDIINDINQEVFVPLREEMRRATTGAPAPAGPIAAQPRPQGAAEPAHYFHLKNKIPPPATARQPVANPAIAPLPPKSILPRPAAAPGAGGPLRGGRPFPPAGPKLLEDHEEPHIAFKKSAPPPPNLPGAMPPPPTRAPQVAQPINRIVHPPLPAARPPAPPRPPAQPYSTDPYREPIGGGGSQ